MRGRGGEKMMRKGREDERRSGGEVKRRRWNGGDEEGRERGGAEEGNRGVRRGVLSREGEERKKKGVEEARSRGE